MTTMASRIALNVAGMATVLVVMTGCAAGSDSRPSNQTMGTVLGAGLGGAIGGLAFHSAGGVIGGALVGALAGNLVGRALDDQERRRLAEATQRAFVAETNEPTVYTVEPTKPAASTARAQSASPATVVAAKPVGPKALRTDGSTCRPIELTATKNGQTTTETTTFCQAADSNDLKPVSV